MIYQFESTMLAEYPKVEDRPKIRPTFLLTGIAVKFARAPTTSESMQLSLGVNDNGISEEFLLRTVDPSEEDLTDWFHLISEGPVALPVNVISKVVFPNTDSNLITIVFLGYWK